MKSFLVFLIAGILLFSCTSKLQKSAPDPFAESASLKSETLGLMKEVEQGLNVLEQTRNGVMVQGRALTEAEMAFIDGVGVLLAEQKKLIDYLQDIEQSENAYAPNAEELLYLNQQANQLVKQMLGKINELNENTSH